MSPAAAAIVVVVVLLFALAYGLGMLLGKRGEPARDWVSMHTRHRPRRGRDLEPGTRPIEEIARDLRRVGAKFHALAPSASYARSEALRTAYDRLLAECCAALGITHLLGVIAPGKQLDAERERVEELITDSGVPLPYAA